MILTALGGTSPRLAEQIAKAIRDCGCNITDARMTALGDEFALIMMISGTWDAIAKIEDQLPRLEKELGVAFQRKRASPRNAVVGQMPYAIDVVCCDRVGVVYDVMKFMSDNGIQIQEMHSSVYQAAHTQTPMFSLHLTISVPASSSISTLRGDFMDFCDRLNLDAIMEPVK